MRKLLTILNIVVALIFLCSSLILAQDDVEYIDSESCVSCHEESAHGTFIEDDIYGTVHEGFECLDCHQDKDFLPHDEDSEFFPGCEGCRTCHTDVSEEYVSHGRAVVGECDDMPQCKDCHGEHNILPADDPESMVYPTNLANTCGRCHSQPELVEKYNIPDLHPVEMFSKSYHSKVLNEDGNILAATCNDCHGVHDIKVNTDPTSTISHNNIAVTCGGCHKEIYEDYAASAHWQALARGERESATCIDCHGEHEIVDPHDPEAPTSKRRSAEKTCARCHSDERIVNKYGLLAGKVSTYQDSYHGLAVLKGDADAATCYDCHDTHLILSADDPRSTVHDDNLTETCGSCHPGANEKFSRSYTHQSVIMAEKPIEYYVRIIYIGAIIVVIGGMFLHNLIIYIEQIIEKYRSETPRDYIQRFTKFQVLQHKLFAISFFTLVVTGFALKYLDSFWADLLVSIGLTEAVRSFVHRAAAVVMIVISVWHTAELVITKSGRGFVKALLPGLSDFKGFYQLMRRSLRLTKEDPDFDRFDYTEKAEYWALIWGTIVMAVTGFILWFPVFFTSFTPVWIVKVAEVFHLYEAWLATLAIFVWHFFFVILHPKEYPMSITWMSGRMTLEEYKHKHPVDYERIMEEVEAVKSGKMELDDVCFQAREYAERHKLV